MIIAKWWHWLIVVAPGIGYLIFVMDKMDSPYLPYVQHGLVLVLFVLVSGAGTYFLTEYIGIKREVQRYKEEKEHL